MMGMGKTKYTGLRAQLLALQAVLSQLVEYPAVRLRALLVAQVLM